MNRNRRVGSGGRDRYDSHGYSSGGGEMNMSGDSLYTDPMMNQQLLLAQTLLQQQQALSQLGMGLSGSPMSPFAGSMGNNLQYLQHSQGYSGEGMGRMGSGGGRQQDDVSRKRGQGWEGGKTDNKRRRQDSFGRGDERDGRSRSNDGSQRRNGRNRNRPSRWDTDNRRDSGGAAFNDAGTSEVHRENIRCELCDISAYDDSSMQRHLRGTKHANALAASSIISEQMKSRQQAQEHLRNIENNESSGGDEYFCKLCDCTLTIPWKRHFFSKVHKQRQLQVRSGCRWCGVSNFLNFSEVLKHRNTTTHRKNAQKQSRDKYNRPKYPVNDKSSKNKSSESRRHKKPKPKEEIEEDLTIPEYDADKPVGLNYIVPVTGFFCKLCNKFYKNEKSAKGTHCQSELHYERFKLAMEAKIAVREKKKAEEEEKAKKVAAQKRLSEAKKKEMETEVIIVEEEPEVDEEVGEEKEPEVGEEKEPEGDNEEEPEGDDEEEPEGDDEEEPEGDDEGREEVNGKDDNNDHEKDGGGDDDDDNMEDEVKEVLDDEERGKAELEASKAVSLLDEGGSNVEEQHKSEEMEEEEILAESPCEEGDPELTAGALDNAPQSDLSAAEQPDGVNDLTQSDTSLLESHVDSSTCASQGEETADTAVSVSDGCGETAAPAKPATARRGGTARRARGRGRPKK